MALVQSSATYFISFNILDVPLKERSYFSDCWVSTLSCKVSGGGGTKHLPS
jgi:hypothetical protein